MTRTGIFNGDENAEFHPQDYLRRSECVKVISVYILFDTKPTYVFPGSSSLSYLEAEDEDEITLTEEDLITLGFDPNNLEEEMKDLHGPNFYYEELQSPATPQDGLFRPSWAELGHKTLTDKAFDLLAQNTGEGGRRYIQNKMNKVYYYNGEHFTGYGKMRFFSYYADTVERKVPGSTLPFEAHFYDPDTGKSFLGSTTINAYWFFNNHFYNAYTNARIKDNYHLLIAYQKLGLSIHYLEDLNNPYHASNMPVGLSNHRAYEIWVDDNIVRNCNTTMTKQSYRYIYDSKFIDMSNNFAKAAKNTYTDCALFDTGIPFRIDNATIKTKENLTRTQRAVCGLINRFYYNGQLQSR